MSSRISAPAEEMFGSRTFVGEKPAKGITLPQGDTIEHLPGETGKSDRARSYPQRTDNKKDLTRKTPGPPVVNTPGPSTGGWNTPSGPVTPNEKIKVRSPGTPGEEYGHPYKENIYPRRTAMEVFAGMFPSYSERQHKQRGQAKRYYRKYYRRKKNRILTQARKRYKKIRNNPSFKRRRSLRNNPKYRDRFRRLPSGGSSSNSRKKKASQPISFFHMAFGWGDLIGFDPDGILVHLDGTTEEETLLPLSRFVRGVVFESEEDLSHFFGCLEAEYGVPDHRYVAATYYRETFTPGYNLDPGPGAQDLGEPSPNNPSLKYPDWEHRDRSPGHRLDVREMDSAPGSAKVIPSGHGFVNKEASSVRVAKRLAELLSETSPKVLLKSKTLEPKGKRFDQKNAMYVFTCPSSEGNSEYIVRMKVERVGNRKKLQTMDIKVSCSCEFWRWQGPEHWASFGEYLYGAPRGTASKPNIKDPTSVHKVCKHVAATLEKVKNWELA